MNLCFQKVSKMLNITKSYVVDENQQPIAVQIPIAEFERLEKILILLNWKEIEADYDWINRDLGRLGEYEPYEWEPGELEEGKPVKYVEGVGLVIGDTKSGLVIPFISNSVVIASSAKQSPSLCDCFAELAMTIKGVVNPDLV